MRAIVKLKPPAYIAPQFDWQKEGYYNSPACDKFLKDLYEWCEDNCLGEFMISHPFGKGRDHPEDEVWVYSTNEVDLLTIQLVFN